MLDCAGLLARAEYIAKQESDKMHSDKNSQEYKDAYQRIMHKAYMEVITPPNTCKYCGK